MSTQGRILNVMICFFRLAIGAVFIYASFDKIAHVSDFARAVHNYKMVPLAVENIMAITLPWIELLAGLFLIVGYKVKGSGLVIAVLLLVFIVAISAALIRGLDISCGCFNTKGGSKVGFDLLVRDLIMLIMTLAILYLPRKEAQDSK